MFRVWRDTVLWRHRLEMTSSGRGGGGGGDATFEVW